MAGSEGNHRFPSEAFTAGFYLLVEEAAPPEGPLLLDADPPLLLEVVLPLLAGGAAGGLAGALELDEDDVPPPAGGVLMTVSLRSWHAARANAPRISKTYALAFMRLSPCRGVSNRGRQGMCRAMTASNRNVRKPARARQPAPRPRR